MGKKLKTPAERKVKPLSPGEEDELTTYIGVANSAEFYLREGLVDFF